MEAVPPGSAPQSTTRRAGRATGVPSLFAPRRTVIFVAGATFATRKSSRRGRTRRTDRPAASASAAVSPCVKRSLLPDPPPIALGPPPPPPPGGARGSGPRRKRGAGALPASRLRRLADPRPAARPRRPPPPAPLPSPPARCARAGAARGGGGRAAARAGAGLRCSERPLSPSPCRRRAASAAPRAAPSWHDRALGMHPSGFDPQQRGHVLEGAPGDVVPRQPARGLRDTGLRLQVLKLIVHPFQ